MKNKDIGATTGRVRHIDPIRDALSGKSAPGGFPGLMRQIRYEREKRDADIARHPHSFHRMPYCAKTGS